MIAKWLIIGWFALGALLTVGSVGKPRKPITAGTAATSVIVTAGLIVLIVLAWPTGSE